MPTARDAARKGAKATGGVWVGKWTISALGPVGLFAVLGVMMFVVVGAMQVTGGNGAQAAPSAVARGDIPPEYIALYEGAGAKYGIDPWIIAGIGSVETNHGRANLPGVKSGTNAYGCCSGPMQICVIDGCPGGGPRALTPAEARGTWTSIAVDGDGNGVKDPWNPADAIYSAANYLKQSGAPADYHRAILAYNHAEWYVAQVMAKANEYRTATTTVGLRARIITEAEKTLSTHTGYNRYSEPGATSDDPTPPAPLRTDCSQWARAIYLKAGGPDPGDNTTNQIAKGTPTTNPKPGDLMFDAGGGHVEIYIGGGRTYGHGSPPIDIGSVDSYPGHFFMTYPGLG